MSILSTSIRKPTFINCNFLTIILLGNVNLTLFTRKNLSSSRTTQKTMETDFGYWRDFLTTTTHTKFVKKIVLFSFFVMFLCDIKRQKWFLKSIFLHLRICNITSSRQIYVLEKNKAQYLTSYTQKKSTKCTMADQSVPLHLTSKKTNDVQICTWRHCFEKTTTAKLADSNGAAEQASAT